MSVLRWSIGVAVIVVALVFASLTATPGDWARVVAWADAEVARGRREAADCPVLAPDPVSGNAFLAYRAADRAGSSIGGQRVAALRGLLEDGATTDEEALAAVEQLPPGAVDALRKAARTDGSGFETGLFGTRVEAVQICDLMPLHDALLLTAKHAGAPPVRLDAWLDAVASSVDWAAMPILVTELYGMMTFGRAIDVASDAWLRSLGETQLRRLADALATVDGHLPPVRFPGWELVHMALAVERCSDLSPVDIGLHSVWETWEHGFSVRAMAAERVELGLAKLRTFLRELPADAPWPLRRERLEQLVQSDRDGRTGLAYAVKAERLRREGIAKLRLLRLAVAHHLGEPVPILPDPLGSGSLARREHEDGIRFASADELVFRDVTAR